MENEMDKKFIFTGVNPHTGRIVTQENAFIFKASDDAALDTLHFYLGKCVELECDEAQIEGMRGLIRRVEVWRAENPGQCKPADMNAAEALVTGSGDDATGDGCEDNGMNTCEDELTDPATL